jgi:hypothetical protein
MAITNSNSKNLHLVWVLWRTKAILFMMDLSQDPILHMVSFVFLHAGRDKGPIADSSTVRLDLSPRLLIHSSRHAAGLFVQWTG